MCRFRGVHFMELGCETNFTYFKFGWQKSDQGGPGFWFLEPKWATGVAGDFAHQFGATRWMAHAAGGWWQMGHAMRQRNVQSTPISCWSNAAMNIPNNWNAWKIIIAKAHKAHRGTPCTAHVSRELVAGFWKRLELPKYGSCWSAFPLTPILYNEVLVSITRKSVFKFTKTGIDYGDYGGPMDRSSVRSWCGSNWVAPESADRGLATNSPCQAGTIDGLKNNWVNLVGAGIFGEGHDSDYIVIICDYNEFEEKTCLQIQVVYLRLDPLMVIILLSQSQLGASCHAACGRCWEDYYCRKIWKKENEGKQWWDLQHMNVLSFSALGRICSNPVGVASSPPATYQALF